MNEKTIYSKIEKGKRISNSDALFLFKNSSLASLGILAEMVSYNKNKNQVFYNRNFHIEPSNICVYHCKFCSYRREKENGYELSIKEMLEVCKKNATKGATEVHIVGSCHPDRHIDFYENLISQIKKNYPLLHIKGFSAVEIDFMAQNSDISHKECLERLKKSGLQSLPGGGAEIFEEKIRKQICFDKTDGKKWLDIHQTAHLLGIPSNATMLYGHIENIEDRINHLDALRNLQDQTKGFNAFIPLKYLNKNNQLSEIKETPIIDDLKTFAISRIYLDNFPHIKAYWPMLGKDIAQIMISFGANDLDGTINDTTTIYSTAGAKDSNPELSVNEVQSLIKNVGKIPVERDSLYNTIESFDE